MSKEFRFFTYLLESYAQYKGTTAAEVLRILDEKKLTDFVYNMYEIYHQKQLKCIYGHR